MTKILFLAAVLGASFGLYAADETNEVVEVRDVSATNSVQKARREAKITSDTVTYDRKEGFAVFNGNVFVNDESYQMHADKVVVFMSGTNDLERIVAMGNVALTNGLKSATGVKASYHRGKGMVILYGNEETPAVVRDESEKGTQSVVGERIRLWIDSERVEVLKANISAPVGNIDKDALRKSL